jgi:hemoglobin
MASASGSERSLYHRIGGYDRIAAIVDEFLQSVAEDSRMERFGSAMNLERRKRNRQLTLDYISAAAGGPTLYLGQDMKTAHAGLGISGEEWTIAMEHAHRALVKFVVPERESVELMAMFEQVKDDIVER